MQLERKEKGEKRQPKMTSRKTLQKMAMIVQVKLNEIFYLQS
jgi:hypothetical protein